jgi:hypothetical protein
MQDTFIFKTVPRDPYSYVFKGDGAAVGQYNPVMEVNRPTAPRIPKDHFEEYHHPVIKPETRYPRCTDNGHIHCSLDTRRNNRGRKTNLTKSVFKKMKLSEKDHLALSNSKKTVKTQETGESETGDLDTQRTGKVTEAQESKMKLYKTRSDESLQKIRGFGYQTSREQP